MNCDNTPTTYAVSGHETTVGHRTDPIALEYGTPFIRDAWFRVDGHCWIEK
jgi:hypothetical protein